MPFNRELRRISPGSIGQSVLSGLFCLSLSFFAGSGIFDCNRVSGRCRFVRRVWFYRHERVGQGK